MGGDAPTSYTISVPAQPQRLEDLHDLIDRARSDWSEVASADFDMVETAVIELAGNAARHGSSSEAAEVTLSLVVDDDAIRATLMDTGAELTVDDTDWTMPDVMDETGRGIAMAHLVVDDLAYEHAAGVNTWRLVRRRR